MDGLPTSNNGRVENSGLILRRLRNDSWWSSNDSNKFREVVSRDSIIDNSTLVFSNDAIVASIRASIIAFTFTVSSQSYKWMIMWVFFFTHG